MKFRQLKAFRKHLARYFQNYGGWRAVFGSPLFLVSLLITFLSYSDWTEAKWVDKSFSIVPSLLGFSLGTYAILFSLMSGRLKNALKQVRNDSGIPFLLEINSTFFHFIFVQVLSLVWAFLFNTTFVYDLFKYLSKLTFINSKLTIFLYSYLEMIGSFIGNLLLVYSLILILGATLAVYRLASIVDPAEK